MSRKKITNLSKWRSCKVIFIIAILISITLVAWLPVSAASDKENMVTINNTTGITINDQKLEKNPASIQAELKIRQDKKNHPG